jgi:hypothetical protein
MRADIWLGVVTVFMAVLGGIVSAHAPTKTWHKIAYVSAFVLAGAASIWLVIRISNENAAANRESGAALKNLGDSAKSIADMTVKNTELQNELLSQSKTIGKLSEQGILIATGGDQYCWLAPFESGGFAVNNHHGFNLMVINSGKAILPYCDLTTLLSMPSQASGQTISLNDIQTLSMHFEKLPGNPKGDASQLTQYQITDDRSYTFSIRSPTRTVHEVITFEGLIPQCTVKDFTSGKVLETKCFRDVKPIKRRSAP